jgi:hypothetical protein
MSTTIPDLRLGNFQCTPGSWHFNRLLVDPSSVEGCVCGILVFSDGTLLTEKQL